MNIFKRSMLNLTSYTSDKRAEAFEEEILRLKKKVKELRLNIRLFKKERRVEKSNLELKLSQIRVHEYRLIMKESKLNELILTKEDQIKRAKQAQREFEDGMRDVNVLLRSKTMSAHNSLKELKQGIK